MMYDDRELTMRLSLEGKQVLQQSITLVVVELINLRSEALIDEKALKSGSGVGANDGVRSAELIADVVRRSARLGAKLEPMAAGLLAEHFGVVSGSEGREEGSHGGGKGIVVGIGRGEEGIAASGREGVLLSVRC